MRKLLSVALSALVLATHVPGVRARQASRAGVGGSSFHKNDITYSTEVVTTRELRLGLQYANFGPVDDVDWFIGAYRPDRMADRQA